MVGKVGRLKSEKTAKPTTATAATAIRYPVQALECDFSEQ
jgi:hypothetical protein